MRYPPPAGRPWQSFKVSRHFTLGEFIKDQAQLPSYAEAEMVRRFAIKWLEPLRRIYGPGHIISGHRTLAHNTEVGGAQNSWHMWERHPGQMAVDIVFAEGNPREWFATADRMHAGGLGLYASHLHIDDRDGRARWSSAAP